MFVVEAGSTTSTFILLGKLQPRFRLGQTFPDATFLRTIAGLQISVNNVTLVEVDHSCE